MNFVEAITVCFQKYAVFTGRARRSEFWWFALLNMIVSYALMFIVPILSTIWSLAVLVPGIAVSIRRMHDVGKCGWFCLIPIYNIILACTEGDKGPNKYGPDPKGNA